MTDEHIAGWDKFRWTLIHLLMKPGDAYLLALGMESELAKSRSYPGMSEALKAAWDSHQYRRRQLYHTLRSMDRNEAAQ